jgi:hypothetical protein
MRLLAVTALVSCVAVLAASPGHAQLVGPSTGGPGGVGFGQSQGGFTPAGVPRKDPGEDEDRPHGGEEKPQEPPPAIPGAQPDENAAVVPADKLAAEMSPNDALFDAISRGDLSAAKDALNRGAQLDSKNVLGQTPIDASIDLDRNDITFLLLSMRPTPVVGAVRRETAQANPLPPAHGRKGRKSVQTASATGQGQAVPMPSANRGQPNPAAGFIGF